MIKISVVIPCRNEVLYIRECIEAIYANELTSEVILSVFVVDGMSDDGTRELVLNLEKQFPNLKLINNEKKLTPFAFNLGIYKVPVDYIQIVGARHILSSKYLQKSLDILQSNSEIWCVGGKLINEYLNETGEIISKAMSTTFGMGLGNFRTLEKSGFTDTVTSPMYPYWVFEKIGFFDEQLIRNQDDDFNFRVTKAGGKIWFEAAISLKYYVRGNFQGLYRQFYQYGYQ
jgi:GT2 family glycosyltransferase